VRPHEFLDHTGSEEVSKHYPQPEGTRPSISEFCVLEFLKL
jgi:hypothetical protein